METREMVEMEEIGGFIPMKQEVIKEIYRIMDGVVFSKFELWLSDFRNLFEKGKPHLIKGIQILEGSGREVLADWIGSEMLDFLKRREGFEKVSLEKKRYVETTIRQKSLERNSGIKEIPTKTMGGEELKRRLVQDYQDKHPELSLKDCVLAVSKSRPEIFKWGSA